MSVVEYHGGENLHVDLEGLVRGRWRQIHNTLRGERLEGSGVHLCRVESVDQARQLWERARPSCEMRILDL